MRRALHATVAAAAAGAIILGAALYLLTIPIGLLVAVGAGITLLILSAAPGRFLLLWLIALGAGAFFGIPVIVGHLAKGILQ